MFKTDKRRVDKDDLKLLYFTDSNQGQCDCVCQCYHVLQGALFNHNDDFCIVVFVIRQNSQPLFQKHRKNCECCPGQSLTDSQPSQSLSL